MILAVMYTRYMFKILWFPTDRHTHIPTQTPAGIQADVHTYMHTDRLKAQTALKVERQTEAIHADRFDEDESCLYKMIQNVISLGQVAEVVYLGRSSAALDFGL